MEMTIASAISNDSILFIVFSSSILIYNLAFACLKYGINGIQRSEDQEIAFKVIVSSLASSAK